MLKKSSEKKETKQTQNDQPHLKQKVGKRKSSKSDLETEGKEGKFEEDDEEIETEEERNIKQLVVESSEAWRT